MKTTQVRSTTTPPDTEWKVPPHLQGKSCVLCGFPFKDGDTHGECPDLLKGELICRVKTVVRDPAQQTTITSSDTPITGTP